MAQTNGLYRRCSRPRTGFTLMELLVVITIVAIVVSITAAAFMQVMVVQRRSNTEQTVKTAYDILDRQWRTVVKQANDEPINDPSGVIFPLAGGDPSRARVIWIKARLKQEFPTNFTEALNPYPLLALDAYQRALNQAGIGYGPGLVPPVNRPSEPGACLLLALQRGRGGITFNQESLGPGTILDTDGDGMKEIIDAWGHPLYFCRWPTANPEVDALFNPAAFVFFGPPTTATFRDTLDPNGLLITGLPPQPTSWWSTNYSSFEPVFHSISNSGTGGGNLPQAYFMEPVIASAGPNGNLGIAPVTINSSVTPYVAAPDLMQIIDQNAANDNIYSYRLRLGARGD